MPFVEQAGHFYSYNIDETESSRTYTQIFKRSNQDGRASYPSPDMGQKWSGIKNTRACVENSQWFSKAKFKAFLTRRGLPVEPGQKTLFDLPAEIILGIAEHLPPSSLVSFDWFILENPPSVVQFASAGILKKSRKLEYSLSELMDPLAKLDFILKKQDALHTESKATSRTQLDLSERLVLLCMLDRDGRIPASQAVCSRCADTHALSKFAVSSLEQPSSKRCCLGSAGSMWICPDRILDFGQAQIPKEPVRTRYTAIWRILKATRTDPPSNEQVREALRPLTAHICPHLRLNDPDVSGSYFQCRILRWDVNSPRPDCQCSGCLLKPESDLTTEGRCPYCDTTFFFWILFVHDIQSLALTLVIKRRMTAYWSCTDEAWIAQMTDPADFEEYESAWHATKAICKGRFE